MISALKATSTKTGQVCVKSTTKVCPPREHVRNSSYCISYRKVAYAATLVLAIFEGIIFFFWSTVRGDECRPVFLRRAWDQAESIQGPASVAYRSKCKDVTCGAAAAWVQRLEAGSWTRPAWCCLRGLLRDHDARESRPIFLSWPPSVMQRCCTR